MQKLPLQIGKLDPISIHEPKRSHACRSQIGRRGRAQSAAADDQHRGAAQTQLAGLADLGQGKLAGIASPLIRTEFSRDRWHPSS